MNTKKILLFSAVGLCLSLTGCKGALSPNSSNTQEGTSTSSEAIENEILKVYRLYAENGGTLSYEEWLDSIKGEKGDDGISIVSIEKTGSEGLTDTYTITYSDGSTSTFTITNGANGSDGVSVVSIEKTGSDGLLDTYTITYSDGSTSSFVVTNGAQGEQGIQGIPGENGHTPVFTIGENGNWFVDGEDTGIHAQGEKGDTGKSAYEIYKEYHPEYEGDEEQWLDDLINGHLGTEDPTTYLVTFDLGYDNRSFTQEVIDGKKAKKPEDPQRNGYYFLDWVDENNDHWVFNGYCITEDITLYAVWSDPIDYTISFVNNDGSLLGTQTGHYGDPIVYTGETPVAANQSIHYDYSFIGWDKELIIIGDMTLTAKYQADYVQTTAYYYDYDKTTLLGTVVLNEGDKPAYPSDESKLLLRDEENKITHEFDSWEKFEETKDSIKFYAKYKDEGLVDGLVIEDGIVKAYTGESSEVRIPESWKGRKVTRINGDGLGNNDALIKVFIPKTISYIGSRIFFYSHNVRIVEVDDQNPTFYSADNVIFDRTKNELVECAPAKKGNYTVPEGIESIGEFAFFECTLLSSITLPDTVKTIKYSAFAGCYYLESIDLGNGVESIEGEALSHCHSLKALRFPATLKSIEGSALKLTFGVKEFEIDPNNSTYKVVQGVLFTKDGKQIVAFPRGKGGDYEIPESVESIGKYAFSGCREITSLTVPGSIKIIPEGAFSECNGLTEINLGEGIEVLKTSCFEGLQQLVSIELPSSVKTVESGAFSYCWVLTTITLGAGIESFSPITFGYTPVLANILVDADNPFYSSVDGVLFNKDKTELICFPRGKGATYVIPENVTSIGELAFFGNETIKNITFPTTLKTIGRQAFNYCTALEHVKLNQGIERIDNSFGSVYEKGLKTIFLPKSLKSINCYEFSDCGALENVFYEGTPDELSSIIKYEGWSPNCSFDVDSPYVYFYSETNPEAEGNYWHYVDGEPAAWE